MWKGFDGINNRDMSYEEQCCEDALQSLDGKDLTVFDPECRTGEFLDDILDMKLASVNDQLGAAYFFDPELYAVCSVNALRTLYGTDTDPDFVEQTRDRLYITWADMYEAMTDASPSEELYENVSEILEKNIQCGDLKSMIGKDGESLMLYDWQYDAGRKCWVCTSGWFTAKTGEGLKWQ